MRVLILGAAGMLGHKLWQSLEGQFDAWATVRGNADIYAHYNLFNPERLLGGIDAMDFDSIIRAVAATQPDVIVNCIGVIKQLAAANDSVVSLSLNSLFPHRLAALCKASRARLIHISTDCVFSGRKGMYTENAISDAEDLYGRTKYLGEVHAAPCLTMRTSIIGRELNTVSGLVEWFLSNRGGKVRGFTKAIYSGFSTLALARIIADVIRTSPHLEGVYHVSAEPISKYDLLCLIRDAYAIPIEIEAYPDVSIDRSLDSSLFRKTTGFRPMAWLDMIAEMAHDPFPYNQWRNPIHES